MNALETFLLQDLQVGRPVFRQRSLAPSGATSLSATEPKAKSEPSVRRAYHQAYYQQNLERRRLQARTYKAKKAKK